MRRTLIILQSVLLLLILQYTISWSQAPNILWITIEDTSPQFIGCYGNEDASTPVIDRLAAQGIRFTNAFSTGTVCSPSRSTIITGVPTYKMGTGHHRSNYPVPELIKGFPSYLKGEGYYTTNNSKTDYNLANEKDFIQEAWHESSDTSGWWNRKNGQPFFSVFNFAESHQSRTMSMSYEWYQKHVWNHLAPHERIQDDAFEIPPFYKDTPQMRKQFARVYNSIKLTDNRIGDLLERLQQDGLAEETIIFLFADHGEGMPRGKTNGINLGYRVPFIIYFPEKYKHLSPFGEAGSVTDELITFEDLAPSILSLVKAQIPSYLKGRIFLSKDKQKEAQYRLLSTDRADNGPDLVRSITDGRYVYSRNFMPFMPEMRYIRYLEIADITKHMRADHQRNLLNNLQNQLFEVRSQEVLYDIENDLWETMDLAKDPKYTAVLTKMRAQLDDQLLKAKDIHFLPEYELGQISKTTTPYEFRLDDDRYPFKAIYAAASLSGRRDEIAIKQQLKLLQNEHNIIRFWAITGLKSQEKEVLLSNKTLLEQAMEDVYPPVAIMAASIIATHFPKQRAQEILTQYCESENMDLALIALNNLLYLDDKTPYIDTVKKVQQSSGKNYNVKAACMDFLGILQLVDNNAQTEN